MTDRQLIEAARKAMGCAYAPYSRFRVGAAILSASGRCFTGCNVENASYGLTICAERVAVFAALAAGEREFVRICVVSDGDGRTPPCGACRQVLWELCRDLEVLMADSAGDSEKVRLSSLLPNPFESRQMKTPPRGLK